MKLPKNITKNITLLFFGVSFFFTATIPLVYAVDTVVNTNTTNAKSVNDFTLSGNPAIQSAVTPNSTADINAAVTADQSTSKGYQVLAPFPEVTGTAPELPTYLQSLIKVAVGLAIVLAVLMIVIGGFEYVSSGDAKGGKEKIRNALWGLIIILFAYILLQTLNPDLLKIGFDLKDIEATGDDGYMTPTNSNNNNASSGSSNTGGGVKRCSAVIKPGPCTKENLQSAFGSNAETASIVCGGESGGNASLESGCDLCSDGKAFSIGLFQINMLDSATSIGCNSNGGIFTTGNKKGSVVSQRGFCKTYSCAVKDQTAYDACASQLKNPDTSISIAKTLSKDGTTWRRWGAARGCGI